MRTREGMFGLPNVSEQIGASPSGAVLRTVRADTVDQSTLAGGFGRWSFVSVLVSDATFQSQSWTCGTGADGVTSVVSSVRFGAPVGVRSCLLRS